MRRIIYQNARMDESSISVTGVESTSRPKVAGAFLLSSTLFIFLFYFFPFFCFPFYLAEMVGEPLYFSL